MRSLYLPTLKDGGDGTYLAGVLGGIMTNNVVAMQPIPKDGDEDDNDCFMQGIHIEIIDNGFLVSYLDEDEEEFKKVYVKGRDDQELLKDLKENLGI